MCIKYSIHCWLGKVARLSSVLQGINDENAQHSVTTRLTQEKRKRLGFRIPRWWTSVHIPSFWLDRHFETLPKLQHRSGLIEPSRFCAKQIAAMHTPRSVYRLRGSSLYHVSQCHIARNP